MSTGPLVSVELDREAAARARRTLTGPGAGTGAAAPDEVGCDRSYALVDLAAEPPGIVALAGVDVAAVGDPVLVALLVHPRLQGRGHERTLLDAVTDRLRAGGARRLRIGAGLALDL